MLRTFHIDSIDESQARLDIAECHNNAQITLSIHQGEQSQTITMNHDSFSELCNLKYSLDLQEEEQPNQEKSLCVA